MENRELQELIRLTQKFTKFIKRDKQPEILISRAMDFEKMVNYQLTKRQDSKIDTITT